MYTYSPPPKAPPDDPPSTSQLDADLDDAIASIFATVVHDEVFIQLGEGRLRPRYNGWSETEDTDWRDMTLAVAAVMAVQPIAQRRGRSKTARDER